MVQNKRDDMFLFLFLFFLSNRLVRFALRVQLISAGFTVLGLWSFLSSPLLLSELRFHGSPPLLQSPPRRRNWRPRSLILASSLSSFFLPAPNIDTNTNTNGTFGFIASFSDATWGRHWDSGSSASFGGTVARFWFGLGCPLGFFHSRTILWIAVSQLDFLKLGRWDDHLYWSLLFSCASWFGTAPCLFSPQPNRLLCWCCWFCGGNHWTCSCDRLSWQLRADSDSNSLDYLHQMRGGRNRLDFLSLAHQQYHRHHRHPDGDREY